MERGGCLLQRLYCLPCLPKLWLKKSPTPTLLQPFLAVTVPHRNLLSHQLYLQTSSRRGAGGAGNVRPFRSHPTPFLGKPAMHLEPEPMGYPAAAAAAARKGWRRAQAVGFFSYDLGKCGWPTGGGILSTLYPGESGIRRLQTGNGAGETGSHHHHSPKLAAQSDNTGRFTQKPGLAVMSR